MMVPHRRGAWTRRGIGLLLLSVSVFLCLQGCILGGNSDASTLVYTLPTRITVDAGETLPGTDIVYVSEVEHGAEMSISGQKALKRKGDSLRWSGEPRSGVEVELRLRVVWFSESRVELLGTAKVTIKDVQPQRATIATSSPVTYAGPVTYSVREGSAIPGTALTYEGESEDGAKIGGTDAYPYRRAGDSIFWEGTLREGVYLRLDVRAVQFGEKNLRLAGLATIWIGE